MQKNNLLQQRFRILEMRFQELETRMASPEISADYRRYQSLARERAMLDDQLTGFRQFQTVSQELARLETISEQDSEDPEFLDLVQEEIAVLRTRQTELESRLEEALLEPEPLTEKDIIVEIRAGTGGEEAALFVADLFRMYKNFSQNSGFKVEVIHSSPTEIGGLKEIIFSVEGSNAYGVFRFESGVHRVQRVPSTEASGRIHTSAATVAVLPEAEPVDVRIDPSDLKIDVYRSAGAGGQHVNTTDSAVRITHLTSGIVVTCQDERSQIKNREKALKVLRAKLFDLARREQDEQLSQTRRAQVGSGDRSEKIRTYNFPDRRVTDHRIGLTVYRIEQIMDGDLTEIIDGLHAAHRQVRLQSLPESFSDERAV